IGDLVWTNLRSISQTSSSINAGSNSVTLKSGTAVVGTIIRTYGGSLSITSGTMNVNGFVSLYESPSRMGQFTLTNSGTATFSSSVRASKYVISGGGNVAFAGTATCHVLFNAASATGNAGRFAQTGSGNLSFANSSRISINGYGTTSNAGPIDVVTTEGTYTYSSSNGPNTIQANPGAATTTSKYTLTNDTSGKRLRVTTVV
ncbi:MAG: hypothetical protein ACKPEY_12455, partial [Planctomycetota bacterium]